MNKPTCSIDGCESTSQKRGWCGKHYRRYQRHGHPLSGGPSRSPQAEQCKVETCTDKPLARNLCTKHYNREMMEESSSFREGRRESYNKWAANNAEYLAERRQRYRTENAEALSQYEKRRAAANPGLVEEKGYTRRRRKADLPILVIERVDPAVVFERDGGTCQICGLSVDASIPFPDPMSATLDHVIPVTHPDSEHSYANTQLAHWDCNRKKWVIVPQTLRSLGEITAQ